MDITPMIDMVFLLLIFFLVASKIDQATSVKLPPARRGVAVAQENAIIVIVKKGSGDSVVVARRDGTPFSTDLETQEEEIGAYVEAGLAGSAAVRTADGHDHREGRRQREGRGRGPRGAGDRPRDRHAPVELRRCRATVSGSASGLEDRRGMADEPTTDSESRFRGAAPRESQAPQGVARQPHATTDSLVVDASELDTAYHRVDEMGEDADLLPSRKSNRDDNEIDMTPMVDTTFLLLLFFMITAAFSLQRSLQVPTPRPEDQPSENVVVRDPSEDPDTVTVHVDENNTFRVVTSRLRRGGAEHARVADPVARGL